MKPKTVVTDIPYNLCSTYVSCCTIDSEDIMKYRYLISRIIAGTDKFFENFSAVLLVEPTDM